VRPLPLPTLDRGDVLLTWELNADGLDAPAIRRMVRGGVLHRLHQGAYVRRDLWDSLTPEDRHRLRMRAVLLRAHPSAVASHYSALAELGVPLWGVDLERVHLTRLDGRAGRSTDVVVQHAGSLDPAETSVHDGVRVVAPARAVLECVTLLPSEPGLVLASGALHRGLVTPAELRDAASVIRRWPGALGSHVVLRLADPRLESVAEARTCWLLYQQGLPQPEPQHVVRDSRGVPFARVDFAWPAYGVFLEFDGRVKYERCRRPGETLEQMLMREKRREEDICRRTGWVCIRITWDDLASPVTTAARIRALLATRSGGRAS
jgi:hypothetical protein